MPCPYGPTAGDEGLRKNIEYFKKQRELVGPDFPLMLDCYMALTVPYAIKVCGVVRRGIVDVADACRVSTDILNDFELIQSHHFFSWRARWSHTI